MRPMLLLLPLLLLVGCGLSPITEGSVSNKKFVEGHYEDVSTPEFDFEGNFTGMSYDEEWVDDAWFITFKNNDNEQSEWRYRTVVVTESTFDRYEIGDWIELK